MDVKVKARVKQAYDMYDGSEKIVLDYTYKADGFKKDSNRLTLIWKHTGETYDEYQTRVIKELQLLTKEEVVEKVKDSIIKILRYKITANTKDEEKKRLLKDLNNIKFSFTVKGKL